MSPWKLFGSWVPAAYCGHLDFCKLIMDAISDKNPGIGKDGTTPLHVAARRGHEEVCKFIINNLENDKNPKDNAGVTPLHLAAEDGDLALRLDASAGSGERQFCAGFDGKLTRRGGGEASARLVAMPVGKQGRASGAGKF